MIQKRELNLCSICTSKFTVSRFKSKVISIVSKDVLFFFILIHIGIGVFQYIISDLSTFLKILNYIYKNIKMRLILNYIYKNIKMRLILKILNYIYKKILK